MKRFLTVFAALLLIMGWTSSIRAEEKSDQFIIINKSTNKLAFYEKGELVKTFSVATGKKITYTPEGMFTIVNKIKNRPYYTKNIPGGDARNPLGDRWLGLHAHGTYGTTYGIHGNSNENSIGKYVSAGCVRMHNEEVRWLFDQVKVNTPVVITNSKLSFEAIAKANKLDIVAEVAAPIEKIADTPILILQNTALFQNPSVKEATPYALSPQKVSAFEKAGDWYHIKTWFGDAWMKPEQKIVGEIPAIAVDLKLAIPEKTAQYTVPVKGSPSLVTSSPQVVEAFGKWGNWYSIHSEQGDRWVNGTFTAPTAVTYDMILPEQMSEEISHWYDEQAKTDEASSSVWNGEPYIFIPRGEVLTIWDLSDHLIVEGVTYSYVDFPAPHTLVKLTGILPKEVKFHIVRKLP